MNIVNLTPHAISIADEASNVIRTIEPTAPAARVSSTSRELPAVDGIPAAETVFGEVTNLPEPQGETVYIVSDFVLRAAMHESEAKNAQAAEAGYNFPVRTDLYRPDTGPTCLRDTEGKIVAVRGLTR